MGDGSRQREDRYARLRSIDGRHPFREAVPGGFVDYPARRVRGCRVRWFHFELAREMGLIPRDHPDRLLRGLERAILDTFAIVIINEADRLRGARFPRRDLLPHPYMATRYLQLQHPGRVGRQSGDGRSVWNGVVRHGGKRWDVSSCGTGVTRLCPATAETQRYFRTGNHDTDYGCGTAALEEGFGAVLMSETFQRRGIPTERVLAIIERPDGFAINVRACSNLLRPSHFFVHSKQSERERLRGAVDSFIRRQIENGQWPRRRSAPARYRLFAEQGARVFARLAARLEREYVFCWLDWDGDNILADGGIIDYGSVRQFGLYHREYRFDDGPRWSTRLPEQRRQARRIVQNLAQIRDFLTHRRKRPLAKFRTDPCLQLFDEEYRHHRSLLLLRNVGLDDKSALWLLRRHPGRVRSFERVHDRFEAARSARGPHPVEDGLNWNAVYSTRDLLRELPCRYLSRGAPLPSDEFFEIAHSSYATPRDRRVSRYRRREAGRFQRAYLALAEAAARRRRCSTPRVLSDLAARAAGPNRFDRITGDAAIYAAQKLVWWRRRLSFEAMHDLIRRFVGHQTAPPETRPLRPAQRDAKRVFDHLLRLLEECRHGL